MKATLPTTLPFTFDENPEVAESLTLHEFFDWLQALVVEMRGESAAPPTLAESFEWLEALAVKLRGKP